MTSHKNIYINVLVLFLFFPFLRGKYAYFPFVEKALHQVIRIISEAAVINFYPDIHLHSKIRIIFLFKFHGA